MKQGNKLVSIIVVNWNGINLLQNCFDSIFEQSYKNLEVIMADCASQDNSVPFVKRNYPLVKIIKLEKDLGPPYAINLATKRAKGNYILILNNDICLQDELIQKMTEELKMDENCVVTPVELNWKGEYVHSGIPEYWIGRYLAKVFRIKGKSPFYPSTACCMTTKDILLSLPLNESLFMYEDTEWGWRLHQNKIKIKVPPGSFFLHKGAGTKLDCSPQQAFYAGRVIFPTCFVCFSLRTFILFSPILMLSHLRNVIRFLHRKRLLSLYWYFKGVLNFFGNLKAWMKIRKKVQIQRSIGDCKILKLMIGSIYFEREAQEKWSTIRKETELHPPKSLRKSMLT